MIYTLISSDTSGNILTNEAACVSDRIDIAGVLFEGKPGWFVVVCDDQILIVPYYLLLYSALNREDQTIEIYLFETAVEAARFATELTDE